MFVLKGGLGFFVGYDVTISVYESGDSIIFRWSAFAVRQKSFVVSLWFLPGGGYSQKGTPP